MVERQLNLHEVTEFAKNGYIVELANTEDDQFLYETDDETWFDHTTAEIGAKFVDGNNGDIHKLHYINRSGRRMVIENLSQRQGMYEMWYW